MTQEELEYTYSKRHLINEISKDINILTLSEIVYSIEEYRNKHYSYDSKNKRISKLGNSLELATSILLNILKCRGQIVSIQQLVSAISRDINDDHLSAVITASELLAVCEGRLYELVAHNHPDNPLDTLAVEPYIQPSEETLTKIDKYMYVPPNVVKPKWFKNNDGGMRTAKDHVILGVGNQHNEYQALDALNILQAIEWELDSYITLMEELPNKPLDTVDKLKQFNIHKAASRDIYKEYGGKKFYFVWKFDKRGRMYSNGYHVNLQASDYKKSILNFAHKEIITC